MFRQSFHFRLRFLLSQYQKYLEELELSSSFDPEQILKYAIYKNLGWANLGLKNYVEAKLLLNQAKSLDETKGAAYCLLAQVLEEEKKNQEALNYWDDCISYGNLAFPDGYIQRSLQY